MYYNNRGHYVTIMHHSYLLSNFDYKPFVMIKMRRYHIVVKHDYSAGGLSGQLVKTVDYIFVRNNFFTFNNGDFIIVK